MLQIFSEFPPQKSDSACLLVFQTFDYNGNKQSPFVFNRQKIWKALALEWKSNHKIQKKHKICYIEYAARFQIYWMLKHLLNILDNFVLSGLLGYSPLQLYSVPIGQQLRGSSIDWLLQSTHKSLFCFSCLNSKFSH